MVPVDGISILQMRTMEARGVDVQDHSVSQQLSFSLPPVALCFLTSLRAWGSRSGLEDYAQNLTP